ALLRGIADDDWHRRHQILVESWNSTGNRRIWNWGTLWLVVIRVTTLMVRRDCQNIVEQGSGIAIGYADATHCRETRGQSVVVRRGINDGGAINGPNGGGAGSLIGGHSGAKKVRNGDRGYDENDGDDYQELN